MNHHDRLISHQRVGSEYAHLLEEAGVDTVVELAGRRANNLLKKMEGVNAHKKFVR